MGTPVQGLGAGFREKTSWRRGEALTPEGLNLRASPKFLACAVQISGTLDCFQMPLHTHGR